MAIVTTFVDNQIEHELTPGYQFSITNVLDFSAQTATPASSVVQAIKVGKGMQIDHTVVETLTAEGATSTATVGDGDGAASWDASVNLNSVGSYRSAVGTDAYATTSKTYAAADTIDLTLSANPVSVAVIRVTAYGARVTNSDGSAIV